MSAAPDEALGARLGEASSVSVQVTIISSSVRSPQRIAFAGFGFAGLFALLSKWKVTIIRLPFSIRTGSLSRYCNCQLKS